MYTHSLFSFDAGFHYVAMGNLELTATCGNLFSPSTTWVLRAQVTLNIARHVAFMAKTMLGKMQNFSAPYPSHFEDGILVLRACSQ